MTRLPTLFVSHGSPMLALEPGTTGPVLTKVGERLPRPKAILVISAHWLTHQPTLSSSKAPETIHDFGGFPRALYSLQYPAPGSPELAAQVQAMLKNIGLEAKLDEQRGLDHGAWSVLKPMFPDARIPVVQLSMDYSRPPVEHYALGQQLKGLRERGVLVVGSGNIVHNLRAARRGTPSIQAYDWAIEFDRVVAGQLQAGQLAELAGFQKLGAVAQQAHPTWDHYLPLLHAAGAADAKDAVRFFNTSYQSASISMRSVVWG